jgi:hypothetical protein
MSLDEMSEQPRADRLAAIRWEIGAAERQKEILRREWKLRGLPEDDFNSSTRHRRKPYEEYEGDVRVALLDEAHVRFEELSLASALEFAQAARRRTDILGNDPDYIELALFQEACDLEAVMLISAGRVDDALRSCQLGLSAVRYVKERDFPELVGPVPRSQPNLAIAEAHAELTRDQARYARHQLPDPSKAFLGHAESFGIVNIRDSASLACSMVLLTGEVSSLAQGNMDEARFLVEKHWTLTHLMNSPRRFAQFLLASSMQQVNLGHPELADEHLYNALELMYERSQEWQNATPRDELAKTYPYAAVQAALGEMDHAREVLRQGVAEAIQYGFFAYAASFARLESQLERDGSLRLPIRALTI